jgi:hypothetical protein
MLKRFNVVASSYVAPLRLVLVFYPFPTAHAVGSVIPPLRG